MIVSFSCKETEKIFSLVDSKKLPPDVQKRAFKLLRMLHRSISINDLRSPPGNRLEKLRGTREGQWSMRINSQWRVCFRWQNNNAYDVEIVDYH